MSGRKYGAADALPSGRASEEITEGCLVLEGGAWRGVYTVGVLDAMMEGGINLRTAVGVSAGALSALGYIAGQIGWGIRIDLTYRHDPNYCGIGAFIRDRGITGFSYLFNDILKKLPLDTERLMSPERRLIVGAADMHTGKETYFEKGKCDLFLAVRASATVPFVSRPVIIDGRPYLDGGCVDKIPYAWAKENAAGEKTVVVKTRERSYRRREKPGAAAGIVYGKYPELVAAMGRANARFNQMTEELLSEEKSGRVFLIAPSEPVEVKRFEGDMSKLAALYFLGYRDMERRLGELKEYLGVG